MTEDSKERFSVAITDTGVEITGEDAADGADVAGVRRTIGFGPAEALMLLDILEAEKERLEEMAQAASPLRMRFDFRADSDSPSDSS